MNLVEFALKFKDMASGQLRDFGSAARTTFSQAQQMADGVTGRNKVLGQSYQELQRQIKQVENTIQTSTVPSQIRAAKRELADLQQQSKKHMGRISTPEVVGGGFSIGGMIKANLGADAIKQAAQTAISFLGGSISDGLERQKIQTSFNVLAGDKQSGQALTKQLVDLQNNTILGAEVFQNAQTMMGFGFDSTEVVENMKMLGDVSMGNKEKLGSLTLAFSQVRAAGKLTGQDMIQFVNAGFNPLEQMSKSTGKSMGQLKDEMAEGNISFSMVQQAFKDATSEGGKFNNMLEEIAKTPAGKMAQFSGLWDEFKVKAGTAFMPLVSFAMELGSKLMPLFEGLITPLTNGLSMAVEWIRSLTTQTSGWMEYVSIIKSLFTEHIFPVIQKSWFAIFNMVQKLMQFISQSSLLKGIFSFVYTVIGAIWDVIGALIDSISWVFDNVVMPILNAIESVWRFVTGQEQIEVKADAKTGVIKIEKPAEDKKQEQTNTQLLAETAKNTKQNNESFASADKSVSSGGPRILNVTVQKFLDTIQINSQTLPSAASEVEQLFLQSFARVLAQGTVRS